MSNFITEITSILSITLTIGSYSVSLGGIALGMIVLRSGISFFHRLSSGDENDGYVLERFGMTVDESSEYHRFTGE
jgi:hypothetical protein